MDTDVETAASERSTSTIMPLSRPPPPQPSRQRSQRRPQRQAQRQALVYAVPGGPTPGIYFGEVPKGCLSSTGIYNNNNNYNDSDDTSIAAAPAFRSFVSQADAERYLQEYHPELVPLHGDDSKGWMAAASNSPLHHQPILYTQRRQRQSAAAASRSHPKRSRHVLEDDHDNDDIIMVPTVPSSATSTTAKGNEDEDTDMDEGKEEGGDGPRRHCRRQRRHRQGTPAIQLDETQQRAIEAAREGKNVFLSGTLLLLL